MSIVQWLDYTNELKPVFLTAKAYAFRLVVVSELFHG